jgi:hypothetical protein
MAKFAHVAVGVAMFVAAGAACAGARDTDHAGESESEIVGAPPSESEDPVQVAETPEGAERAESSGSIGVDEQPEGEADGTNGDPSEPSPSDSVAVRASEAAPSGDETDPPASESESRCFSCVRICSLEGDDGAACEGGDRDVICGWGVHDRAEKARKMARAECDGALDIARQTEQWSRIEGECPPPECRDP